MKARIAILILSLILPITAQANEKRDLIDHLLELTNARENHELMIDSYIAQFKNNPTTAGEEFEAYFRDAMSWESSYLPTLAMYEELFTTRELEAIVDF
ncbi:hypothetical protein [Alteromonas facilis]|uniref:hypothetical protein n=1 Tax=Alteromonas facilis TaxID=2048004 RepID=UPI000C282D8B|nr:hypothetical protein [Alteromonas facilis]